MTDMDRDELRMLGETVAKVLLDTERAELLGRLDELGWFDLWADQPGAAAHALFGEQGRLARTSPALTVLMGAAAIQATDFTSAPPMVLPRRAAFESGAGWLVPGPDGRVSALAQRDALDAAGRAVVPLGGPDGERLLTVEVGALRRTPVEGLDPDMGLDLVELVDIKQSDELAGGDAARAGWAEALALGRRLIAEELVGVTAEQARLAGEHAAARSQFGRPIGSFQAVKHKLAEVHVALTVAELAAEEAWATPGRTESLLAKLLATAGVEQATVHCQQVLGGIGFTWEHAFHRYARRGRVLAGLLGTRGQLARELGAGLVESGSVPALAPL